jgi:general nucleoside transport system ATP-binding protein
VTATMPIGEATIGGLARLMVGEMRDMLFPTIEPTRKDDQQTAIAASALSARDDRGHLALDDVSLELRYGEILGVAGVSGNGQRELSEVMTGLRTPSGGTVKVRDAELAGRAPARFIEMGVGHVPEDPKTGLAFGEALTVNAALKSFDDPSMARGPWLVWSRIRRFARRVLELAGLGALTSDRMVATLSGGQAQRLLVYREIDASRGVLVVAHPTRGLDVAATQAVHEALLAAKRRDVGVLLISEDLDEVMALSDRLIVLYEGRLMATRAREEFHREEIGALMGGVHAERESTST